MPVPQNQKLFATLRILSVWTSSSPPVAAQIIHYVNRGCSLKCRHYQARAASWHRSDCVAQPGLVPQEKGQTTRARIWGAIVFVDYASCWVKVHLMQDATGDKCLGDVIFSIYFSERVLADCLYSGTKLGIHPTSGLFGERRCSLVVIMSSPLLFVTIILRTFDLYRENISL